MSHMARLAVWIIGVLVLFLSAGIHSAEIPPPNGTVLLTITGDVQSPNVDHEVHLDLAALESLPVTEYTTRTPWHDSPQTFTGVRLSDLLTAFGSQSRSMVAYGLDDYHFTISDLDFDKYPVMIAYRQNGNLISVRSLGPLRIIMPIDEYPELLTPLNESRSVWQLVKLELH